MRIVKLEGVLIDNGEFISMGKSIRLTKEHIKKYVTEVRKKK